MVKVQLPAEVGRGPRRGYHVNVVPPSGGCAAHPLAVLHVAEQVRELKASVWTWMVASDENRMRAVLIVLDVAQHPGRPSEKGTLQFGAHGHLKGSMLEVQCTAVLERQSEP